MGTVYTPLSQLPLPDEDAADDVPYWLSQVATKMDPALVLYATSTTDRDARFTNAPAGAICSVLSGVPANPITGVYVKNSAPGMAVWGTVWQPPLPQTWTNITLASGFVSRGTGFEPQIMQESPLFAVMKGSVAKASGGAFSNLDIFGFLPSGFTCPRSKDFPSAGYTGTASTFAETKVSLTGTSGQLQWFGPTTNIVWIGLDGIRIETF
jgi:hypothetical protein